MKKKTNYCNEYWRNGNETSAFQTVKEKPFLLECRWPPQTSNYWPSALDTGFVFCPWHGPHNDFLPICRCNCQLRSGNGLSIVVQSIWTSNDTNGSGNTKKGPQQKSIEVVYYLLPWAHNVCVVFKCVYRLLLHLAVDSYCSSSNLLATVFMNEALESPVKNMSATELNTVTHLLTGSLRPYSVRWNCS